MKQEFNQLKELVSVEDYCTWCKRDVFCVLGIEKTQPHNDLVITTRCRECRALINIEDVSASQIKGYRVED